MPCDPCVAADARERVGGIDADVLGCAAILIAGARDSKGAALAGVKNRIKLVGPKLAANAVRGSKIKRPFKIVGPTPRAGGVNMRVKEVWPCHLLSPLVTSCHLLSPLVSLAERRIPGWLRSRIGTRRTTRGASRSTTSAGCSRPMWRFRRCKGLSWRRSRRSGCSTRCSMWTGTSWWTGAAGFIRRAGKTI